MRKAAILIGLVATLIVAGLAEAKPGDRLRERLGGRDRAASSAPAAPAAPAKQTIAYGTDPLQNLDFYPAANGNRAAPLVIFVHGGGWKRGSKDNAVGPWQAPHYTGEGYAYASINYRLVPDNTVEQQAADVAAAIKALIDRAAQLRFDRSRIVIMGHSAGAHLVALVGTDEQYLKGAGLSFRDLDGVIPIDGAAYNVVRQMTEGNKFMSNTYRQAFGTDPTRHRAVSPSLHTAAPNAPAFLIIHVQRPDGISQAQELEANLRSAGTTVARRDFPGEGLRGHMEINRSLGDPAYAATPAVDAWLNAVFGS